MTEATKHLAPTSNSSDIFEVSFLERNSSMLVHDGRSGSNRSSVSGRIIDADDDLSAISAWLRLVINKKSTFDSYRKEAERLILWATVQLGKPFSSLNHDDMMDYKAFLADPQPASRWIMTGKRLPRNSENWRPFCKPLIESSIAQSMNIIGSLFSWLVKAKYLNDNPLSLSRARGKRVAPRITRYLEDDVWAEVKRTILMLPEDPGGGATNKIRTKWLFTLLFVCGLRITEVASNSMGSFFLRRDRDGNHLWWLEVLGKGGKKRLVPATNELMAVLSEYRVSKGLSAMPVVGESTPIFMASGNSYSSLKRSTIHVIVKEVFALTSRRMVEESNRLIARGLLPGVTPAEALDLQQKAAWLKNSGQRVASASAHWLRHTAGSNMVNNGGSLIFARDNLGHESIATTSGYLHSDDDDRHRGTENHHHINW